MPSQRQRQGRERDTAQILNRQLEAVGRLHARARPPEQHRVGRASQVCLVRLAGLLGDDALLRALRGPCLRPSAVGGEPAWLVLPGSGGTCTGL